MVAVTLEPRRRLPLPPPSRALLSHQWLLVALEKLPQQPAALVDFVWQHRFLDRREAMHLQRLANPLRVVSLEARWLHLRHAAAVVAQHCPIVLDDDIGDLHTALVRVGRRPYVLL